MIWTRFETQEIDSLSSEEYGIYALDLMEEAGRAVFQLALTLWQPYTHFILLAGAGNNGGDALVAARLLHEAGFSMVCIDLSEGIESPARREQRCRLNDLGCGLSLFQGAESFHSPLSRLIIIDGAIGIGIKGPLRGGPIQACLSAAAAANAQSVVAIDLPSGLDADAWKQEPPLLKATQTITFGALKPVHLGEPSRSYCGQTSCVALSFAREAIQKVLKRRPFSFEHCTARSSLAEVWSFLPSDAHKYDRGHVLAIGGSPGKVGAILLAASAASKAGAGWVSVAPLSETFAPAWPPEFTYESILKNGSIDSEALSEFINSRRVQAVLIGPGTVSNPITRPLLERLHALQEQLGLRILFDAGALRDLFLRADGLVFDPERTLITPHPGEWKNLGGGPPAPTDIGKLSEIQEWVARYGMTAIYKSATPLVISPGRVSLLTEGDNRLARAGSGDVLSGLILGLSASPLSLHAIAAFAQNLIGQTVKRFVHSPSPLALLEAL